MTAGAGNAVSERAFANCLASYESLPPNFSLLQNMAAGAFAGIAVCFTSLPLHCLSSLAMLTR